MHGLRRLRHRHRDPADNELATDLFISLAGYQYLPFAADLHPHGPQGLRCRQCNYF
jgi:hypothetical protein